MPFIENASNIEVRAVIRYLNAKRKSPTEIHKELVEVYGKNIISRKQVSVWCKKFREGRTSLFDEQRVGRPTTGCNALNEYRVEQLLLSDSSMKLKEIAGTLNLSKTTVHRIVHDTLGYRKIATGWVPKQLAEQENVEDNSQPPSSQSSLILRPQLAQILETIKTPTKENVMK